AYVAWVDGRSFPNPLRLQRVTSAGAVAAGWPAAGLLVGTAGDNQGPLAPDGAGGGYGAVEAGGSGVQGPRLPDRSVLSAGWPAEGVALDSLAYLAALLADGSGGVFASWLTRDFSRHASVIVQRIAADGAVASGWPSDGVTLLGDENGWAAYPLQLIPALDPA